MLISLEKKRVKLASLKESNAFADTHSHFHIGKLLHYTPRDKATATCTYLLEMYITYPCSMYFLRWKIKSGSWTQFFDQKRSICSWVKWLEWTQREYHSIIVSSFPPVSVGTEKLGKTEMNSWVILSKCNTKHNTFHVVLLLFRSPGFIALRLIAEKEKRFLYLERNQGKRCLIHEVVANNILLVCVAFW